MTPLTPLIQWRREGFWRPGANVIFVAPRRMIFCGDASSDLFFTSPFAFSALNPSVWCCHRYTPWLRLCRPPLTGTNNNKIFYHPLLAPLPLAPGGNCPLTPLAPPLPSSLRSRSPISRSPLRSRSLVFQPAPLTCSGFDIKVVIYHLWLRLFVLMSAVEDNN
jgi:hypothetical protein